MSYISCTLSYFNVLDSNLSPVAYRQIQSTIHCLYINCDCSYPFPAGGYVQAHTAYRWICTASYCLQVDMYNLILLVGGDYSSLNVCRWVYSLHTACRWICTASYCLQVDMYNLILPAGGYVQPHTACRWICTISYYLQVNMYNLILPAGGYIQPHTTCRWILQPLNVCRWMYSLLLPADGYVQLHTACRWICTISYCLQLDMYNLILPAVGYVQYHTTCLSMSAGGCIVFYCQQVDMYSFILHEGGYVQPPLPAGISVQHLSAGEHALLSACLQHNP